MGETMPKAEKKVTRSPGEVGRVLGGLKAEIIKHLGKEWGDDVDNIVDALDDVERYGETRRSPSGGSTDPDDPDEEDFA